ncbi:glycoside hydrolase family 5 protein [Evansella tamaricis]|nr:glycoside hydrolase family 5 protein [Evansella tamaricis]
MMRRKILVIISFISVIAILFFIGFSGNNSSSAPSKLSIEEVNGQMTLVNEKGDIVQLKGMSTHGLQWYSAIVNHNAFAAFANDWNANVIRLAMYIGEAGYAQRPEQMMERVTSGIDHAIANDLYVIVDWHVHHPGDPNHEIYEGAMDFFKEISSMYPNHPNIIYELANEPNEGGDGVTNDIEGWRAVKSYAEPIIEMLRESGNENLIIVGTPNWSQRPDLAAEDPIDDDNTAYTLHFYSGSHNDGSLMDNARIALDNGVAVFVTEWGTSEASGNNGPYIEESDEWLDFLDEHHISWVNWSASNKQEASAAFIPYTILDPGENQAWSEDDLTDSGIYVRSKMRGEN